MNLLDSSIGGNSVTPADGRLSSVALSICLAGVAFGSEAIPLSEIYSGAEEIREAFVKEEPSSYDYAYSYVEGIDPGSGFVAEGIHSISNLFYGIDLSGYDERTYRLSVEKIRDRMREFAEKEAKKDSGGTDEIWFGVRRYRRHDDNYRLDDKIGNSFESVPDWDALAWRRSLGQFVGAGGSTERWSKDYVSKSLKAGYLPGSHDLFLRDTWEPLTFDREIRSLAARVIDVYRRGANAGSSDREYRVLRDLIGKATNGQGNYLSVEARRIGSGERYVALDFIDRAAPKYREMSMICSIDDDTRPLLTVRRNQDSGIDFCSFRGYRESGELRYYGFFSKPERFYNLRLLQFHFAEFLPEVAPAARSDPNSGEFIPAVSGGWSLVVPADTKDHYGKLFQVDETVKVTELPHDSKRKFETARDWLFWLLPGLIWVGLFFVVCLVGMPIQRHLAAKKRQG